MSFAAAGLAPAIPSACAWVSQAAKEAKARWIVLHQPSTPSGPVYLDADIKALSAVHENHAPVLIRSDEIYENNLFDGRVFRSFAALCSPLTERRLTIHRVSKLVSWPVGASKRVLGGTMGRIAYAVAELEGIDK